MSAEDLASYLRVKMGEKRLKNTDVVRKANISRRTWYRLLNADIQEAKLSTLVKLANALDTTVTELLQIYFDGKSISSIKRKGYLCSDQKGGVSFDINYPDNSLVNTGEVFTKTWKVVNNSNRPRKNLVFQCFDDQLDVKMMRSGSEEVLESRSLTPEYQSIVLEDLAVNESLQVSVTFKAPSSPCTTVSYWCFFEDGRMIEASDLPHLSCQVKVVNIN